ncbi:unnamed protein product [Cunninghamella blakesleeana]
MDRSSINKSSSTLVIGERVIIPSMQNIIGTLRFMGTTDFKPGIWCGIELDTIGTGKNNGSVRGVQYFECPEDTGLFIMATKVFPEPKSSPQRQNRERIKSHVQPVASKSARVSSKTSTSTSSASSFTSNTPLPKPSLSTKRSITTRKPSNAKSSITTRSLPKARASASPVVQHQKRPSNSPVRQNPRASASPTMKRSSTSSSHSSLTSHPKHSSVVRISGSTTVHFIEENKNNKKEESINTTTTTTTTSNTPTITSSSPTDLNEVYSTSSSPHTNDTSMTTKSNSSNTTRGTSPIIPSSNTPTPPPSSSPDKNKPLVDMEELHQLYDLLQKVQREKDVLIEQMSSKDAAFERLVSAKESYALQVEEKEQTVTRLKQLIVNHEETIESLSSTIGEHETKIAKQVRDDATDEQHVRRIQKLESLVATLQEQSKKESEKQDQLLREHAGQLDLIRRELDQEKQVCLSLEKECDSLRSTSIEAIDAYERSIAELKQDHQKDLDEKELRLRQTQQALDDLKRQLHSFDTDDDLNDHSMIYNSSLSHHNNMNNNNHHNNHNHRNDDDDLLNDHLNQNGLDPMDRLTMGGTSPISYRRLSSQQQQYESDARSWSEQRHRLEDQLDLTMTELENERLLMQQFKLEKEKLLEENNQLRIHQNTIQSQYTALQKELTKEIEDKRRLMEEADTAFEVHAKTEDDLYQLKLAYESLEKQLESNSNNELSLNHEENNNNNNNNNNGMISSTSTSSASSSNYMEKIKQLENQCSHWKLQYQDMEQECMRLMDEMLEIEKDTKKKNQSSTNSINEENEKEENNHDFVKSLQQELKQIKKDHEKQLISKQVEIQKLSKELADLESLVETKVFSQGETEEALEMERLKVKQLEKQINLLSMENQPIYCDICHQEGHDLLTCQEFKKNNNKQNNHTELFCEYCDAYDDHITEDCPNQDETF